MMRKLGVRGLWVPALVLMNLYLPGRCLEARHSRGDLPERAGVFQVP